MRREQMTGKFYMNSGKGLLLPEDPLQKQIEAAKLEKDAEKAKEMFLNLEKQKQKELDAKMDKLEMLPMFNKVIILPYPTNPYRKVMQGNIIVDFDGSFDNPDSGEKDELKVLVGCAKVIEVGPEVNYLEAGDDVFYDTRTVYPMPFLSLGYQLTQENQILSVLNEGLKARFNEMIKEKEKE